MRKPYAMCCRYVVIGIADGRPAPTGAMGFENIADLKVMDQTGRTLASLSANATPPDVAQTTSTLQMLARQSLGAIGQGMHWFVFDGNTIHSCDAGKLSIPYAGETYTYDTPIPGCPKP